jgi:hypothetical protein
LKKKIIDVTAQEEEWEETRRDLLRSPITQTLSAAERPRATVPASVARVKV